MMAWSSWVLLAALAPAPAPAAPAESVEPVQRDYEGVSSFETAADATGPQVVTETPTTADPQSQEVTAPLPPPPFKPIQKKKEVPRALSTTEALDPKEVAVVGKGRTVSFVPGLQVRNQVGWVSAFQLDRNDNQYDEGGLSTGRIRWNPTLRIGKSFELVGMLDVVNGRWAPSGSEDPVIDNIIENGKPPGRQKLDSDVGYLGIIDPRELYIQWRFRFGMLRLGQQSLTWGQGMLANTGNYVDRFGDMRFGDDGPGDLYERVVFITKPFTPLGGVGKDIIVALGGDLVYRDERVNLRQGDLAGQAVMVLRYQPDAHPGNWIGGYGVYRNQNTADDDDVYSDDDDLEVGAVSLAGQGTRWLRRNLQLIGAFEAVFIGGRTTIARDDEGDHTVLQGGAVVRGYLGNHKRWLVGFDGGYASGDPDPNDRFINNFTMDAGHTVGLVLFQQVNGWRTAQTEVLATDGELTGVPLNGTQFIPTRGGASNAIYFHPKARYSLWERLEIWGGPLFAWAPVPIFDPFTSNLGGGVPINSVGGDGDNRFYGTELDIGIRGRFDIRKFWLQAGLQGGILIPGDGLANASGDTERAVGAVWFRTEIRY